MIWRAANLSVCYCSTDCQKSHWKIDCKRIQAEAAGVSAVAPAAAPNTAGAVFGVAGTPRTAVRSKRELLQLVNDPDESQRALQAA